MPTSLRLMREADAPEVGDGRTFGYSRTSAALVAALVAVASVALLAAGRARAAPLAYYVAAVALALLVIFRELVLARFRPTNWLVRLADDGLYVKFRSYLNHHMSAADPTVLFIPFREIRAARLVRETQQLPSVDHRNATTTRRRTLVEVDLRDDVPDDVAQALAAERTREAPRVRRWYGSSSGRYRHYPVRMASPRRVEVEWGVVPGASSLLGALAAHAEVEARDETEDYTRLAALAPSEQERRLRQLAEGGEVITAVRLARSLYGYGLAKAKDYVATLASGTTTRKGGRDA